MALELLILTAARTSEVLGANWAEIDLTNKVWTIPASRMKANKEHRVPLSARAVAILEAAKPRRRSDDLVFPGAQLGRGLSNMVFLALLKRMGRADITAHGFRSTFSDWVAEETSFQLELAEMALAHTIKNKVTAAYRRGDLFEKRRVLADAWAKHCDPDAHGNNVIPLAQRAV